MSVISFVSSKGGVGKTTAAVVLAGELAAAGKSVTLIDADPNRPLEAWSAIRAIPSTLRIVVDDSVDTIIDTIDNANQLSDFVIVDLEGTATDRIGFAIARSDFVLIPSQGSMLDANEAAKAIRLIRNMERVVGRSIVFRVFFSRVASAIRERTFRDIERQFQVSKIPTLPTALLDRAAYRALFSIGGVLDELGDNEVGGLSAARENSRAFAQAVINGLQGREIG
ncbi:ParA family protein [Kozakia baliensis]|uniref:Chromosome partitioning protein n=1 Tax=Kozakia baliensis TaxID=153496 RepID=A0A1D8UY03_9PROT|nr:ParA family protein [Kozakia baliensis]AOX18492.1 chromosome partitioning protein [Kozakia baliensis]GBR33234.1 ATPase [Kozakia baliensis NRIC 0488]GEL65711.1 chromosome partitioning protein ParA [Kozakia baliensis]